MLNMLLTLRSYNIAIVMVAHSSRKKVNDPKDGSYEQNQPNLPGKCNDYAMQLADAVLFIGAPLTLIPDGSKDGKGITRALVTNPPQMFTVSCGFCIGKNSYSLPPVIDMPSTEGAFATFKANVPWLQ